MPSQAVKRAEQWAAQAKDLRGSKLRQDGLCILAGVVSIGADDLEKWDEYKKAVIADLLAQHGDRLHSVVEHNDEAYPHLHYYIVPKDGEEFNKLHPGLAAKFEAKHAKKNTSEQNIEYKAAMVNFQTNFFERVSRKFGMLRDGPKKERVPRPVWKAQQAAAKRDAAMMRETEAKCQALMLEALEATAGQTAAERVAALAQLKNEMETLRADNARVCEADTKAKLDQVKAETQAAAIKLAEAKQVKQEAEALKAGAAATAAAAVQTKQEAEALKAGAAATAAAAVQTKQEAEALKAGAAATAAAAVQIKQEAEALRAGAAATAAAAVQTKQEADKKNMEADAKVKAVKDQAAVYIAKTKGERATARQEGYAEGVAAGTPNEVKELKTELQKADERTTRNYNLAIEATRRAAVWEQSDKQKSSEIAGLKGRLQALTPALQHNNAAPGNAPSPRL